MFESHIYAYGPHGFSVCNSAVMSTETVICNRAPQWVADSIEWLKDVLGDFGDGDLSEPKCGRRVNGDTDSFLSVDCTLGHLMANGQAYKVLEPVIAASNARIAEKYGDQTAMASEEDATPQIASAMTLRDVLSFGGISSEVLEQLDRQLNQIPNE